MDRRGFLLETCDATSIFNEVEAQYGPTSYGKERYGREELYWLGYLYRYWTYTYEKSSKQVYKQMKPKDLRKLYYPYHSLNPAQAIERILEGSGSNEDDYTEKGVQILRGILEREKKRTIYNRTAVPNEKSGRRFYVGAKSGKLVIRQVLQKN